MQPFTRAGVAAMETDPVSHLPKHGHHGSLAGAGRPGPVSCCEEGTLPQSLGEERLSLGTGNFALLDGGR